ncbi:TPA: hypothetical protein OUT44_004735 [Escherichia coli]|nr:hypothetical protein [Escherichia coli]
MLFSLFPRADPVSGGSGSADPSLPPAGPLSQDVVSRSADMTLYVVFLPVFPSQSSAAERSLRLFTDPDSLPENPESDKNRIIEKQSSVIYHGYYIAGYYCHDYFSGQLLMVVLIIAG